MRSTDRLRGYSFPRALLQFRLLQLSGNHRTNPTSTSKVALIVTAQYGTTSKSFFVAIFTACHKNGQVGRDP
jgi:hypothetical protein